MGGFDPDAFLAKHGDATPAFDPDAFLAKHASAPAGPSLWDQAAPVAAQGLAVAGKGLDYQGGVSRGVLANLAQKLTGAKITTPDELSAAANPTTTQRFPSSSELLARVGVPSGSALSSAAPWAFRPPGSSKDFSAWNPLHYAPEKGGMLDVTPRGAAGAVLDTVTDPLTYEMGGANKLVQALKNGSEDLSPALRRLTQVLNPASNAAETVGKAAYRSGMAPLVMKGEKYGQDVADSLYRQGMWGRGKSVADRGDAAAEVLKSERGKLLNIAQDKIDKGAVPFTPVEPKTSSFGDPVTHPADNVTVQDHLGDAILPGKTTGPTAEALTTQPVTTAIQDPLATQGHPAQPDLFGGHVESMVKPGEVPRNTTMQGYSREAADPLQELVQKLKFSKAGGEAANPGISLGEAQPFTGAHAQLPLGMEDRAPSQMTPMGDQVRTPLGSEQLALPDQTRFYQTGPEQVGHSPLQASAQKAFQPYIDEVNAHAASGVISKEQAQSLIEKTALDRLSRFPRPTLQQLTQWKTALSQEIPDAARDIAKKPSLGWSLKKAAASGNRAEVERAADAAIPGMGSDIGRQNQELGHLLTVQGVADKQALRDESSRILSPQDVRHAATTGLITDDPTKGFYHMALDMAARAWNSRAVRNSAGYGLQKLGTGSLSAPLLDATAAGVSRNMMDKNQPHSGYNPWGHPNEKIRR